MPGPEYWIDAWKDDRIGFHQKSINRHLVDFWPHVGCPRDTSVFVPLCGKSGDMDWLAESGWNVVGVEVSQIAVREYYRQRGSEPESSTVRSFQRLSDGHVSIYVGDFFNLTSNELKRCGGLYDRAALIAFDPIERRRYARHLLNVMPDTFVGLILLLDYNQDEMDGPPYPVSPSEIDELFGSECDVSVLRSEGVLGQSKFSDRLSRLDEHLVRIERPRSDSG